MYTERGGGHDGPTLSHMTKKKRIDIVKEIQVHHVTDGSAKGWTHTHGLAKFGRPELEIRNVPGLFAGAATALINEIADYMLNDTDRPVLAGQVMQLGRMTVVRFHEAKPDDAAGFDTNHYRDPVLRIDSVDMPCSCCTARKVGASA
jgi:hypothetical protein